MNGPSRDKPAATPSSTPSSAASAAAAAAARSAASSSSSRSEDLSKTWRSLANCLIMAAQKADKAATAIPPAAEDAAADATTTTIPLDRETDDYVVNYLKIRINWGRLLTYLEAELEGKAQEMQSLQHYYRSMPKCSRPRKRARLQDDEPVEATTAAPTEVTLKEAAAAELPPAQDASEVADMVAQSTVSETFTTDSTDPPLGAA